VRLSRESKLARAFVVGDLFRSAQAAECGPKTEELPMWPLRGECVVRELFGSNGKYVPEASAAELLQAVERFLESSQDPVLCEPGEDWLAITPDNFVMENRGACAQIQAWDERRNLVRRVVAIERETRGKLVLKVARFPKLEGTLELIDRRRAVRENVPLRSARLEFREQFRRFLRRQLPAYKLAELTTEADLEHTLSPAYPRALLKQGATAWAAIGAAADSGNPDGLLTFGLIWLDYLREREPALAIQGLVLYLPASHAKTTCLRLLFLDPAAAEYRAFVFDEQGLEERVDWRDFGNLDTHLDPYRRRALDLLFVRHPDVETVRRGDGELSFRVRGLEFARTAGPDLLVGFERKRPGNAAEARIWADELARVRSPDAADRSHPLYLKNPEAWLESQVRSQIRELDATLLPQPVYGQVPAFAATDRAVLDLLACDHYGRLAVIELKASEDVHLPLQALDYWMRVRWHAERGEFQNHGYFPKTEIGREVVSAAPRLLLVAPALDFHPSNERVLRYFSPDIAVERVGVGLQWRKELKVMFRS
jgi:hypothetical protein